MRPKPAFLTTLQTLAVSQAAAGKDGSRPVIFSWTTREGLFTSSVPGTETATGARRNDGLVLSLCVCAYVTRKISFSLYPIYSISSPTSLSSPNILKVVF
ncbi:hypothetical protein LX36DRAFT_201166 [Colletotrichum falcatum]|nr:hypothetical protein LX36DRAFT_201166 [Colletotrichum falcatum]